MMSNLFGPHYFQKFSKAETSTRFLQPFCPLQKLGLESQLQPNRRRVSRTKVQSCWRTQWEMTRVIWKVACLICLVSGRGEQEISWKDLVEQWQVLMIHIGQS